MLTRRNLKYSVTFHPFSSNISLPFTNYVAFVITNFTLPLLILLTTFAFYNSDDCWWVKLSPLSDTWIHFLTHTTIIKKNPTTSNRFT